MQIAPLTMQDFMSVASFELELSREYVLEKVLINAINIFRCVFWQFHISAWGLNTDFCISSRKCWESISIRGETQNIGTAKQLK
jgi:hypothetical protein